MTTYKYKLSLEVEEGEQRTFAASREFDDSDHQYLKANLASTLADAMQATMRNDPVRSMDIARFENYSNKVLALALAYNRWDSEDDFDDCVEVTIDVTRLVSDIDTQEVLKQLLITCGVIIKQPLSGERLNGAATDS